MKPSFFLYLEKLKKSLIEKVNSAINKKNITPLGG